MQEGFIAQEVSIHPDNPSPVPFLAALVIAGLPVSA
jgi:hypothetical protein